MTVTVQLTFDSLIDSDSSVDIDSDSSIDIDSLIDSDSSVDIDSDSSTDIDSSPKEQHKCYAFA